MKSPRSKRIWCVPRSVVIEGERPSDETGARAKYLEYLGIPNSTVAAVHGNTWSKCTVPSAEWREAGIVNPSAFTDAGIRCAGSPNSSNVLIDACAAAAVYSVANALVPVVPDAGSAWSGSSSLICNVPGESVS